MKKIMVLFLSFTTQLMAVADKTLTFINNTGEQVTIFARGSANKNIANGATDSFTVRLGEEVYAETQSGVKSRFPRLGEEIDQRLDFVETRQGHRQVYSIINKGRSALLEHTASTAAGIEATAKKLQKS